MGSAPWRAVPAGRIALTAAAAALVVGLGLAGARVVSASTPDVSWRPRPTCRLPPTRDSTGRPRRSGCMDQHGEMLTLEALVGRPALVTFAFGHCETVCPAVVHAALEVQRQQREARRRGSGAPGPRAADRGGQPGSLAGYTGAAAPRRPALGRRAGRLRALRRGPPR